MPETEHVPPMHPLPIDDPSAKRMNPPPFTKLPPVDPKVLLPQNSSTPTTPKPPLSPKVEKLDRIEKRSPPSTPPSSSSQRDKQLESKASEVGDATSIIDMETFNQILELDEEDNREFSKGMVYAYFSQVAQTFDEMDEALEAKNLAKLSNLGHFLKGSSAALGVSKVQHLCEDMQHYGNRRDEQTNRDLSEEEALELISELLGQVKADYAVAEAWLRKWYDDHPDAES